MLCCWTEVEWNKY